MEGLATAAEVAEYLGVKPQTLRVWAMKKTGPDWIKVGEHRRYDWNDVRAWINSRKVKH